MRNRGARAPPQLDPMNTLPVTDLRTKLRKKTLTCVSCKKHIATDVHHLDGNHSDNTPANLIPWCKLCHDQYHGITAQLNDLTLVVRQFYAVQDMRKAMSNRIQAYHRLGYYAEHAGEVYDQTKSLEDYIGKVAAQMVKEIPIYQAWLKHVTGIGPALSAAIVSNIGSVDKFATISALWAYSGLDVGRPAKDARGKRLTGMLTCGCSLRSRFPLSSSR